MLSDDELRQRLRSLESDNVERTRSVDDTRKFAEAICAFANDLGQRNEPGVLFIGVADDGSCANIEVTEALLQRLLGLQRNGNIVPLPSMTVRDHVLDACRMVIVEVQPSDNPPVKYDGRVCVRRGPSRGYATPEEERRLTEKRRWGALPFDQQPLRGTSVSDLDPLRFRLEYLPSAVAPEILDENHRDLEDQLRAVRFLTPSGAATAAGILVVGKDPLAWLPGAYVQFVRYPGVAIGEVIRDEKRVDGPLSEQFRLLDDIIAANIERRGDLAGARQDVSPTYPTVAVRELIRNAVIHRNYEATATPVRLTWFDDRIEIISPGGPYGEVTAENFGRTGMTAYRNPAVAQAARAMGFAQRFGSGIPRAQSALRDNRNPEAVFEVTPHFVHTRIGIAR